MFFCESFLYIKLFTNFVVIHYMPAYSCRGTIKIRMMKKIYFTLILSFFLLSVNGQSVFSDVTVVNGKVVFQQFVHIDQGLSIDQRYSLLYKWGKDNYTGNPLLSGIRFDDKNKSITVSSKIELLLPQNSNGVREKVVMNYRFDASVTNAGLSLVVRDINYQNSQSKGSSIFPKTFTAEDTITPSAISSSPQSEKEFRVNTQRSTLYFLNELYSDLSQIFSLD